MMACNMARARLILVGALALACTRDERNPLAVPPSFTLGVDPVVSGVVLGPDGSNVCNTLDVLLGPGAPVVVRPIDLAAGAFAGFQVLGCPSNAFSFDLFPGNYLLRAQLPADPAIGSLPWRNAEKLSIGDDGAVHDIRIAEGTALGGMATFDGSPLAGVDLNFVYDSAPAFGAAITTSGPDGRWTEFFGRTPPILQNGVRLLAAGGCGGLGVTVLEGPPPGPFVVPTDLTAINCSMATAPSTQFSHTHTRVVVTPMPGDIGGQSVELADRFGIGWGVQFPVEPGQTPLHVPVSATHLFGGGLMIGIAPDRILSGISLAGQLQCGAACRDLGLDGTVAFTPETPLGKQVTWRYSDATSPEGAGLRVVQRSFDGQPPNDYVLFRFSIQNGGAFPVTFYAGVFMDWDVGEDATDDFGFTDLGGRLMAVTSEFESTIHVGSMLVGAPVSGNLFYNFNGDVLFPFSTPQQFEALSGVIRLTDIGPGDAHYIQGLGPITLSRGRKADIWLAIVAGDNREQFLANARAAAAGIATRQQAGGEADDGSLTVSTTQRGVPVRPFSKNGQPR